MSPSWATGGAARIGPPDEHPPMYLLALGAFAVLVFLVGLYGSC